LLFLFRKSWLNAHQTRLFLSGQCNKLNEPWMTYISSFCAGVLLNIAYHVKQDTGIV